MPLHKPVAKPLVCRAHHVHARGKDGECGTRCECLSEFGKLSGFESTWWSDMAVVPCPLEVLTLVRIVTLEAAGTNHELRRWNGQSKVHQGHVPTRYLQWRYTISRLLELNMIRENKKQNTLIFSPPMPKNGQDNQKLNKKELRSMTTLRVKINNRWNQPLSPRSLAKPYCL